MDTASEYILSIIVLAFICGILLNITALKTTHGKIIKLMVSLILAIAAASPLITVRLKDFSYLLDEIEAAGDVLAIAGNQDTYESINALIKEQTETYILEKASALDASIHVSVILSEDQPAIPIEVNIGGDVSPYAKQRLIDIISTDLGVAEEKQKWE